LFKNEGQHYCANPDRLDELYSIDRFKNIELTRISLLKHLSTTVKHAVINNSNSIITKDGAAQNASLMWTIFKPDVLNEQRSNSGVLENGFESMY